MKCGWKCFSSIITIITILICITLLILVNYISIHTKKNLENVFLIFLFVYIYLVVRLCLSFMLLISFFYGCCIIWSIFVLLFDDVVLLIIYISIYVKHKQTKEVNIMFILSLICFIFDILSLLGLFLNNNDPDDCLLSCFKKGKKNIWRTLEIKYIK